MKKINSLKLSQKIENNEPIKLTFKYIDEELLMITNSIIARLLSKTDQIFLLNSVITIMREVLVNALKANAKRVFFRKHNLDIHKSDDYEKGIIKFKNTVIGEFDLIQADLMNSDYFVETVFKLEDDRLLIRVNNNAHILPEELERIQFRIEKASAYNNFTDAYEEIEDSTEGAGLGIVLTILLLSNMGIPPKNYAIRSKNGMTETNVLIPKELKPKEIVTEIKDQILSEIDGIPTFPEHIMILQKLCNDPESSIDEIARRIKADPALTSDVIKLSNSAGFVPGKRIETVNSAIMTIGLKNVNAILIACNARKILNERYSTFEQIWNHCNKTAFYARNIANKYKLHDTIENAVMAGLLHDLGKIILLSTDRKVAKKIGDIVQDRKIPTAATAIEEISIGISHATLGSMLAEKWNFPEYLIQAIKFHHSPQNSDDKYKTLNYTVYLANMLCGIETRKYSYYYIEDNILEFFKLGDIDEFKIYHESLKKSYEDMKTSL